MLPEYSTRRSSTFFMPFLLPPFDRMSRFDFVEDLLEISKRNILRYIGDCICTAYTFDVYKQVGFDTMIAEALDTLGFLLL